MDRMNELNQAGDPQGPCMDISGLHRDLVVSRVVDADVGTDEELGAAWREFSLAAAGDAALWAELARAQHQQAWLCRDVYGACAGVDHAELPTHDLSGTRLGERFSARSASRWGGWAVAALITLAWVSVMLPGGRGIAGGGGQASIGPRIDSQSPQEAFDEYLRVGQKAGRVVGEMPEWVMVESNPAPGGRGFEVVYLRQILEKRTVPDLYRFGADESGRGTLVPVGLPGKPGGAM